MLRKLIIGTLGGLFLLAAAAATVSAQSIVQDDSEYENSQGGGYDEARIDRFLDVEVWTDHNDGEYYSGDNIVVYFRANRDAFISIYSIDTRGRVNLLFPADPTQDNYIRGGVTYRLPGEDDGYDLEVTGPEGFENIQIIASRESFPIPNWYNNSGMICDWDDRAEYMDHLNSTYFVKYGGQRFAYDRAAVYVNEWEEYYYRPIYRPYYPSWTVCGNVYIDYPWGANVYVNGVYWGCAPLYIPRIAIGWHTITVYDHFGYCWESDFHVSRYNTVVFNREIVHPLPTVRSKYKEVRTVGYRDPVNAGYPTFDKQGTTAGKSRTGSTVIADKGRTGSTVVGGSKSTDNTVTDLPKKYSIGSGKIVKTDRGYESDISGAVYSNEKSGKIGSTSRPGASYGRKSTHEAAGETTGGSYRTDKSGGASGGSYEKGSSGARSGSGEVTAPENSSDKSTSGSGYYQRKSGSSSRGSSSTHSGSSSSEGSSSGSGHSGSSSSGSKSKSSGSAKQSSGGTPQAEPAPPAKSGGTSEKQSSGGSYHPSGGGSSSSSGGGTPKASEGNSGSRSGSSGKSKR